MNERLNHPAETPDLGELRLQQAKILEQQQHILHHLRRQRPVRHGWLGLFIKDLETNPHTQYKIHLYGAIYWLINFPLVIALFFGAPGLWLKLGIFITLMYSIYANFTTDYGSMSSAMAAFGQDPLPEIPGEAHPFGVEPAEGGTR
jgi:hypothetical protein